MRFTVVILSAMLCLSARAEGTGEKNTDDDIVAAAEKLVAESQTAKTDSADAKTEAGLATTTTATATTTASTDASQSTVAQITADAAKENEIPAFTKTDKQAKSEGTLIWRLVGSMAFIALVGGILVFASRRWSLKKNKGGEKTRIEVLHQYHLGPKKSLVLVRVAGEAILIGATDHSVNMLKTITLIDDELEGVLGKDFNGFLEDEFSVEDMRTALSRA